MNQKWLDLAADLLLEHAAKEFSDHGCNNWDLPDSWTTEEKQEIVKAMHKDNGDSEGYDPNNLIVPDWWVMTFLAKQMKRGTTDG